MGSARPSAREPEGSSLSQEKCSGGVALAYTTRSCRQNKPRHPASADEQELVVLPLHALGRFEMSCVSTSQGQAIPRRLTWHSQPPTRIPIGGPANPRIRRCVRRAVTITRPMGRASAPSLRSGQCGRARVACLVPRQHAPAFENRLGGHDRVGSGRSPGPCGPTSWPAYLSPRARMPRLRSSGHDATLGGA
jgi:hypothetical protein